jgi:arylsulfatase A-like enzyme
MADDMGYAGLSCTGNSAFRTPHLDALAASGLRFTDFHSNGAVCSPTRAALLTGRYQQRTGVDGVVNADPGVAYHHRGLQLEEITFAEAMRGAGYATGICGKWHVGYAPKYNPVHQGFDFFVGFVSGNIDYISHYDRMETFDWWHGLELTREEGYSTHLINRHAVEFIRKHKDEPFCLYVAHEAIHNPNQGPNDPPLRGPNKNPKAKTSSTDEAVRAMTLAMDEGVGEIVAVLKELGIEQETLVMFLSDNGGTGQNKSTGPLLRGQKGSVWEGGHRVPAIASWPGRIKPGTVTAETAMTIDLMPTMVALGGARLPDGHRLDGIDLSALLLKNTPLPKRDLFWSLQNDRAMAARRGPWKLVVQGRKQELYNLADDLKETRDMAADHPEIAKGLRAALSRWKQDVTTGATVQPPPPEPALSTPRKNKKNKTRSPAAPAK